MQTVSDILLVTDFFKIIYLAIKLFSLCYQRYYKSPWRLDKLPPFVINLSLSVQERLTRFSSAFFKMNAEFRCTEQQISVLEYALCSTNLL
jgi:hypothetical protein